MNSNVKILVHPKSTDYSGRCTEKRSSVVVSLIAGPDFKLVSLPARLVTDQMSSARHALKADSRRFVEAMIMKHMPSNFLSLLHLLDLNILQVLSEMDSAINIYRGGSGGNS